MRKKSRIFVGPGVIADVSGRIARALRSVGYNADYVTWSSNRGYMGYSVEKEMYLLPKIMLYGKNFGAIINQLIRFIHLIRIIIKYDVFIMLRSSTIFYRSMIDMKMLKFFRKKVYIIFTGCPERDPAFNKSDPDYICNHCEDIKMQRELFCDNLKKKKKECRKYIPYATRIISLLDVGNFVSDQEMIPFLCPVDSMIADYSEVIKKFDENKIIICHLPSNLKVKGSKFIIPVLERIKAEYSNVEVIIKDRYWERERILTTIKNSHILIESLSGIIYGAIGAEALSAGCVVMSSYPEFISRNYDIHAVVRVTSENLYDVLCDYIDDREKLIAQAKLSREFYLKYHAYEAAGAYYKEKLNL
ncbi:MAG: hypothetical protein K9J13_00520 [Saprospiraceae bacterium]|nr:hypothetical protein [Saprospiraceae bacterium]